MAERFFIEELMEEVERYLAAVELFRALGCEPVWKTEHDPARHHADAGRVEPPLRADIRLH